MSLFSCSTGMLSNAKESGEKFGSPLLTFRTKGEVSGMSSPLVSVRPSCSTDTAKSLYSPATYSISTELNPRALNSAYACLND